MTVSIFPLFAVSLPKTKELAVRKRPETGISVEKSELRKRN